MTSPNDEAAAIDTYFKALDAQSQNMRTIATDFANYITALNSPSQELAQLAQVVTNLGTVDIKNVTAAIDVVTSNYDLIHTRLIENKLIIDTHKIEEFLQNQDKLIAAIHELAEEAERLLEKAGEGE